MSSVKHNNVKSQPRYLRGADTELIVRIAVPVLSILLTGCMSHTNPQASLGNYSAVSGSINANEGELDAPVHVEGLGALSVGRSYVSASGRVCRRLNTQAGESLPMRSCQDGSRHWYTTRALLAIDSPDTFSKKSSTASFTESSTESPAAGIERSAIKTISLTVEQGETLWSFAERTTGNPLNWKTIAEYNQIEDVGTVAVGHTLQVDASLLKDYR